MHPTRAVLAATLALAAVIPVISVASASADTTLNIVPHGNEAPGVPWATAPGILPADTQAKMYDRITPLFRNVTDDVLKPSTDGSGYYKSAALLPESDPSFVTSETVAGTVADRRRGERADQARQLRRPAHLRRHRRRRDLRRRLRGGDRPVACCSTRRATTASPG